MKRYVLFKFEQFGKNHFEWTNLKEFDEYPSKDEIFKHIEDYNAEYFLFEKCGKFIVTEQLKEIE